MRLNAKEVSYSDLLLDPKNPRLATCFTNSDVLDREDPAACQAMIEQEFNVSPEHPDDPRVTEKLLSDDKKNDEEESVDDFFSVKDLVGSMRRIGFVGIQNIIVREHLDSTKYVVLEGNRRVAAIKSVIRRHETAIVGASDYIEDGAILDSLKTIRVMVFDTKGRSENEIQKEISTMLGLRHYGSQLNWELLPRAKNIYDEYMRVLDGADFSHSSANAKKVAATLAIESNEVKKLLRGYLCYKHLLTAGIDVKSHHFSLVLAVAEAGGLQQPGNEYLEIDRTTFELGGDTPERFDDICQFAERDTTGFEKILKDPKQCRKLGQIKKDSLTAPEESVRGMATGFFDEVVERRLSLDDAYTQLLAFKKRQKWVPELRKLLDKQGKEEELAGDLSVKNFIGQGQQLKFLESLKRLVRRLKAMQDL